MKQKIFNMDAFEFVRNYPVYISELEQVVKPELLAILEEMKTPILMISFLLTHGLFQLIRQGVMFGVCF